MDDPNFPDVDSLTELLINAVEKVFLTMLQVESSFIGRLSDEEISKESSPFYKLGTQDPLIVGAVGFAGEANGVVYLYMEYSMAVKLAAMMTGMDESEIQGGANAEIVKDVVGELSNMTVGSFKNGICDLGFNCRVTLPTVLRGSEMAVDCPSSNAQRYVYCFNALKRPVVADLFITSKKPE